MKKALLSFASIFLIWISYKELINIHHQSFDAWGLIIITAFLLNLYITGIFAFAGFAFPTQKLLPLSYYKVKQPKKLKKTYQQLRVDIFRKMLLATFWKDKAQRKRYFDGTKDGIENLETQSMKSEFGHLLPFILINVLGLYFIFVHSVQLGLCMLLINLIGNFYPIILQRHHRMRIQILRRRQESS